MALRGKVALVTGGKRQIGRGIALALADAGAAVVGINDLEQDADATETMRLLELAGCKTAFFAADVSSSHAVSAMFTSFLETFGRIDVLANNPYKWEPAAFTEISEESWDMSMGVCLKGYFLCSQAAARAMITQGEGGAIVSTSSVHAKRAWQGDTVYGIAKAGILRLTQSMAVDLASHNIRCNAVLPGYMDVNTPWGSEAGPAQLAEYFPAHPSPGPENFNPPVRDQTGTPEDIGRAVSTPRLGPLESSLDSSLTTFRWGSECFRLGFSIY